MDGSEQTEDAWFTLNREYLVLAVSADPGRAVNLRIIADDRRTPVLVSSEMFMTLDESIPITWTVKISEGGLLDLAPKRWHEVGFWESFFDRDPEAERIFDEEVELIQAESDAGR